MGDAGAAFASTIAYIIATLVIIISFAKISGNSWKDILLIKKQDFQDYKNIIFKIRRRILDNVFNIG